MSIFILDIQSQEMLYKKHLSEPWFSLIKLGHKTIEGRLNKGDFLQMNVGDVIEFENNDFGLNRLCKTIIIRKTQYSSFKEFLEKEGLQKCLPSIDSIQDGVKIYYNYFSKQDEELYGIISIEINLFS